MYIKYIDLLKFYKDFLAMLKIKNKITYYSTCIAFCLLLSHLHANEDNSDIENSNESINRIEVSILKLGLDFLEQPEYSLKTNTLTIAGKYSQKMDEHLYWFAQADLKISLYSSSAELQPSNNISFKLDSGTRYYFAHFHKRLIPFSEVKASIYNLTASSPYQNVVYGYHTMGISYGSDIGLRVSLSEMIFLDLNYFIFSSNLYLIKKTTTKGLSETKSEDSQVTVKQNQLFIDSLSDFSNLKISLGIII